MRILRQVTKAMQACMHPSFLQHASTQLSLKQLAKERVTCHDSKSLLHEVQVVGLMKLRGKV